MKKPSDFMNKNCVFFKFLQLKTNLSTDAKRRKNLEWPKQDPVSCHTCSDEFPTMRISCNLRMAGVPFSRGGVFKGVSLCDSTMGVPS